GSKLSSGRAVFDFFREKTGTDIEWYTAVPDAMTTRVWNEIYSDGSKFDVLHGYDAAWLWYPLKNHKMLMQYVPQEASSLHAGMSDPDGYFHHFSGTVLVSMYNPNRLETKDLPKKYKDLLDPRWKDRLCTMDWIYARNPLMIPWLTWMYALHGGS